MNDELKARFDARMKEALAVVLKNLGYVAPATFQHAERLFLFNLQEVCFICWERECDGRCEGIFNGEPKS